MSRLARCCLVVIPSCEVAPELPKSGEGVGGHLQEPPTKRQREWAPQKDGAVFGVRVCCARTLLNKRCPLL